MTDRITKHVSAMKEYGRKPYLVTADAIPYGEKADYRYMMDTTWIKAQDDEKIVVQSVKKKPYQNSDYPAMEQGYDSPIFTFPQWNFQFDFPWMTRKPKPYPAEFEETQIEATGLRWIQCPTSVSASKTYTIIVQNSSITTRTLVGGRTNSTQKTYLPTSFELTKATSDANGLSISNIINKGSTTWITLTTSSSATGSYYIYASDGNNTIKKTINATSKISTIVFRRGSPPYTYYKLDDLVLGNEIPYTVFTAKSSIFLTPVYASYTYNETTDYPAPNTKYVSVKGEYALTDGTSLTEYETLTKVYYNSSPSTDVSHIEMSGIGLYLGGPVQPPCVNAYNISINYNGYPSYTRDQRIENSFRFYAKYPGFSLFYIDDTASFYYIGTNYSGSTSEYYANTGIRMDGNYFIDENSYVVRGVEYDGGGGISNYHCSGIFSISAFSFNLSWSPTVYFGEV